MVIKLDQVAVIAKFRSVHGEKYDYSKLEWVDRYTKFIIICPIHGEFQSNYNLHAASKSGCTKCGLAQRAHNSFTSAEIFYLKEHYETDATKETIATALPNHSWNSILYKANTLGLTSQRKHQRQDQLSHLLAPTILNAYLWGLIYADGHLSRSGSVNISLWKKDQDYLSNLSRIFDLGDLKPADNKGVMIKVEKYDTANVTKLKALLNYRDRKTYNPPKSFDFLTSAKMRLAFFVGLTDGDGCLTFDHNRTFKYLRIIQHHNWYPFLRDLSEWISRDTDLRFATNDTNSRKNASLYMGGKKQHQYLIDYIEREELPVLKRKWYNKNIGYNTNQGTNEQTGKYLKIL